MIEVGSVIKAKDDSIICIVTNIINKLVYIRWASRWDNQHASTYWSMDYILDHYHEVVYD